MQLVRSGWRELSGYGTLVHFPGRRACLARPDHIFGIDINGT
jgi:hypothetical protein